MSSCLPSARSCTSAPGLRGPYLPRNQSQPSLPWQHPTTAAKMEHGGTGGHFTVTMPGQSQGLPVFPHCLSRQQGGFHQAATQKLLGSLKEKLNECAWLTVHSIPHASTVWSSPPFSKGKGSPEPEAPGAGLTNVYHQCSWPNTNSRFWGDRNHSWTRLQVIAAYSVKTGAQCSI